MILDRRLMQDDNRGLGQGVKDSVLTLEPFKLLLERRMGGASVSVNDHQFQTNSFKGSFFFCSSSQPTAQLVYHSLVGHATLDSLLHPLHTLVSGHTPHTLTPYTPLPRPFPCDLHLVNLRTLLDSNPASAESALIVHRRGFDCGFDVGSLDCSLVNGEV